MPGQMSPARTMLCGNSRPNPRPSTAGYRWEVFLLVPFQTSSAPHIAIGNEDRDNENAHLDKTEPAKQVEFNRKRVQEDDLNIEDDEQHRNDEVPHRNAPTALRHGAGFDTGLIAVQFSAIIPPRTD